MSVMRSCRRGTSSHPRGVTETGSWLGRDIGLCHAAGVTPTELLCIPTPIRIRTGEFARCQRRIFGSHRGYRPRCQGFKIGGELYGINDWFADGATAKFCSRCRRTLRETRNLEL